MAINRIAFAPSSSDSRLAGGGNDGTEGDVAAEQGGAAPAEATEAIKSLNHRDVVLAPHLDGSFVATGPYALIGGTGSNLSASVSGTWTTTPEPATSERPLHRRRLVLIAKAVERHSGVKPECRDNHRMISRPTD